MHRPLRPTSAEPATVTLNRALNCPNEAVRLGEDTQAMMNMPPLARAASAAAAPVSEVAR